MTKELDEFAKKAIPILKKYNYLEKDFSILKILVILFIGIFIGSVLLYGIMTNKLSPDFSQNITVSPAKTDLKNEYSFNPSTTNNFDNKNNFTIINEIVLPDNLCVCNCG